MTDQHRSHASAQSPSTPSPDGASSRSNSDGGDTSLSDLYDELRVLLPGTTTLTAFLIILPFNSSFAEIRDDQKAIYVVTFLCSVLSLILFTAPAAHHRLQRPLWDREGFKNTATRFVIAGLVPLSVAITFATELVLAATLATRWLSIAAATAVGLAILAIWWIAPIITNHGKPRRD
jgi:amino acid transporter